MPKRLPVTFRASGRLPARPLPSTHEAVTRAKLPQIGKNQAHGHVGDVVGEYIWRCRYPNAALPRSLKVDSIRPDPIDRDDLKFGQRVDQFPKCTQGAPGYDALDARRHFRQKRKLRDLWQ